MNALTISAFRNYLAANTISYLGSWTERLAISWIAWEISRSAFWTGLVATGHLIPAAFLGPVFGALAEDWDLRRASITIGAAMMLLSTSLFLAIMFFHPPVQILAIATVASGILVAMNHPIRLATISQLVPAGYVSSAARFNATSFNLSRVLGPALAGLLIATVGADWTLSANPLSFIPILFVFLRMRLKPKKDNAAVSDVDLMRSIQQGLRYLRLDRMIAWCMIVTATNALLTRGVLEIIPVIVGQLLHGNSNLLAAITSASGGGAILASLIAASRVPSHANAQKTTSLATIGGGIAIAAMAMQPTVEVAIATLALTSFCATLSAINSQTLVYGFTDEAYRVRTLAWWSTFSLGGSALGGVLLSTMAEFASLKVVLGLTGILAIGAASRFYFTRPDVKLR